MIGVEGTDLDEQLRFVSQCCTQPLRELLGREDIYAQAVKEAGEIGYGNTEANFLYCFIFTHRPKRIIQIGAGFSTAVMLRAARDASYSLSLTCVEPFPSKFLRRSAQDGQLKLLVQRAQDIELSEFVEIAPGDLLFVDSTHTVKVGSEVNYLILEVLPRLPGGAYVHFHDIYFPYDYQRSLMHDVVFWSESTLLHAFLIGNRNYSIAAALSMLHYGRSAELQTILPRYRPQANDHGLRTANAEGHFPSAIYLWVQSP